VKRIKIISILDAVLDVLVREVLAFRRVIHSVAMLLFDVALILFCISFIYSFVN
jgi:hypothetical protein